jgi:hypothetical protein
MNNSKMYKILVKKLRNKLHKPIKVPLPLFKILHCVNNNMVQNYLSKFHAREMRNRAF